MPDTLTSDRVLPEMETRTSSVAVPTPTLVTLTSTEPDEPTESGPVAAPLMSRSINGVTGTAIIALLFVSEASFRPYCCETDAPRVMVPSLSSLAVADIVMSGRAPPAGTGPG